MQIFYEFKSFDIITVIVFITI